MLAELSGNIKIYYNNQGEIETEGQILENLGMRIDSTSDFKTEVLIAYDGMPVELEYLVDSNGQYILMNNIVITRYFKNYTFTCKNDGEGFI